MNRLAISGALLLAGLAGCGSAAQNDANFKPGNYRLSNEIVYITSEGTTKAQHEYLKSANVGRKSSTVVCFNSASTRRPMLEIVTDLLGTNGACRNIKVDAKGGTMTGGFACAMGGDESNIRGVTMKGTYNSTSIAMDFVGVEDLPDIKGGKLNTLTKSTFTRIGECT